MARKVLCSRLLPAEGLPPSAAPTVEMEVMPRRKHRAATMAAPARTAPARFRERPAMGVMGARADPPRRTVAQAAPHREVSAHPSSESRHRGGVATPLQIAGSAPMVAALADA